MAKEKNCNKCGGTMHPKTKEGFTQRVSHYDGPFGRMYFCSYPCKMAWIKEHTIGMASCEGQCFIREMSIMVCPKNGCNVSDPDADVRITIDAKVSNFQKIFRKGVRQSTERLVFDAEQNVFLKNSGEIREFINTEQMAKKVIDLVNKRLCDV